MTTAGAQPLFRFAVLTDAHVNGEEDASTSPYASNRLANARLRWVVAAIDRCQPTFAVHLGDAANPLPELPGYGRAAASFRRITADLGVPLHLVAGNHCVGDKPTGWVPVPRISPPSLDRFEELFGRQFYSFEHGPCHFAALNSLLINSGLEAEREQRAWLERDLATAGSEGRRIWLLMHYPAFVAAPDEPGSYDNLDPPGRDWLLELLERHRVEAALSGHVHNFFLNRFAGTDLYTLPATSFVRQDYSELYSVAPADPEGGRDDRAKLGFCLVEVFERGHALRLVRSHGRTLAPGESDAAVEPRVPAVTPAGPPVGVEMRESWLAPATLRTNNSVSPFTRRAARNDWAVAALEEMGVSRVRLALSELRDEAVPARMAALEERGYRFTVYSYGTPRGADRDLVLRHRAILAGWELILPLADVDTVASKLAGSRLAESGPPCYLSELREVDRGRFDDANVKHEANYGFQLHERGKIDRLAASAAVHQAFAGLVFRLRRRGEPRLEPWQAIREIGALAAAHGLRHQAHLLFSGDLTAERLLDDLATAGRVAESVLATVSAGNVDLCLDTFEDTDRGYFVRHGLVDRRYNPRLAARVLGHLSAALARWAAGAPGAARRRELAGGSLLTHLFGATLLAAALPRPRLELAELELPRPTAGLSGRRLEPLLVDLDEGGRRHPSSVIEADRVRFEPPLVVERPALLVLKPAAED